MKKYIVTALLAAWSFAAFAFDTYLPDDNYATKGTIKAESFSAVVGATVGSDVSVSGAGAFANGQGYERHTTLVKQFLSTGEAFEQDGLSYYWSTSYDTAAGAAPVEEQFTWLRLDGPIYVYSQAEGAMVPATLTYYAADHDNGRLYVISDPPMDAYNLQQSNDPEPVYPMGITRVHISDIIWTPGDGGDGGGIDPLEPQSDIQWTLLAYDEDMPVKQTAATGPASHAEGQGSEASGAASHAEGVVTLASGAGAKSSGKYTTASGDYSQASGVGGVAGHDRSYVWSGIDVSRSEEPEIYSPERYASRAPGSYNVNPDGGLTNFFVGDTNLQDHIISISGSAGSYVSKDGDTMSGELTNSARITIGTRLEDYPNNGPNLAIGQNVAAGGAGSIAAGVYAACSNAGGSMAIGAKAFALKPQTFALGHVVEAQDIGAFVWRGRTNNDLTIPPYTSHGDGTFNIAPSNDTYGFYIGEASLHDHIVNIAGSAGSINLDDYIAKTSLVVALEQHWTPPAATLNGAISRANAIWEILLKLTNTVTATTSSKAQVAPDDEFVPMSQFYETKDKPVSTASTADDVATAKAHEVAQYIMHRAGGRIVNGGLDGANDEGDLWGPRSGTTLTTDVPPSNYVDGEPQGYSVAFEDIETGALSLQSSSNYDPLANVGKFTIMAWVKRTGGSSQNTAARIVSDMSSKTASTAAGFDLRFAGTAGKLIFKLNGYTDVNQSSATSATGIPPGSGEWHHVAVSVDLTKTEKNVLFFVDGKQQGVGNTLSVPTTAVVIANTSPFTIGNAASSQTSAGTDGSQFIGEIDNVRIFRDWAVPAGTSWAVNPVIQALMNECDAAMTPDRSFAEPEELGEMDPRALVYTAEQVESILAGNSPAGIEAQAIGNMPTNTPLYYAEQIDEFGGN